MQRLALEALLADDKFNVSEAARKAGYKNPAQSAVCLLKNKTFNAAMGHALQERIWRLDLDPDRILRELLSIGLSDPGEMFDENGTVMKVQDMPQAVRRSIAAFKVKQIETEYGTETITEVKFWDKNQALTALCKHLGLIRSDGTSVNVNVSGDNANLLEEAEQERKVVDTKFIEEQVHAD